MIEYTIESMSKDYQQAMDILDGKIALSISPKKKTNFPSLVSIPMSKVSVLVKPTSKANIKDKSPKKMSMSPKINIGPMIDSEKFHEKSRNSLWEAFMTSKDSKEKPKPSKSPSVSPREPVIPKIVKKDEEKREETKDSSPTDSKYLL